MAENLRHGADEVIDSMGKSIRRNESERVGMTLLANSSDLKVLVSEVERATLLTADLARVAIDAAGVSSANTELLEKEIERFSIDMLRERMPGGLIVRKGRFFPIPALLLPLRLP